MTPAAAPPSVFGCRSLIEDRIQRASSLSLVNEQGVILRTSLIGGGEQHSPQGRTECWFPFRFIGVPDANSYTIGAPGLGSATSTIDELKRNARPLQPNVWTMTLWVDK
jgi:hypothetical protein